MWAETLPSGKVRYAERYRDETGAWRRVSCTLEKDTTGNRKLATEILRQKMKSPSPSTLTFGELCELYISDQSRVVKRSTLTRNIYSLNVLKSILGDSVASDGISAGYVRRCLLSTGKSATTLNEYLARIKALMRWAYRCDYVSDIRWLDKLEKFPDRSHREKAEDKYLESWELTALLESMINVRWRRVTEFLALSGLRFGECAALNRADIDLGHRLIKVTKNYDYHNDVTTSPKNHSSVRDVFIQDELLPLCETILHEDNLIDISGLLFCYHGKHIGYEGYRSYLIKQSRAALGREITPHCLRHTHASLMLEAGMDVDTIAARLGHSSTRITQEIYLHVTERLERQRNEAIKNVRIIGDL